MNLNNKEKINSKKYQKIKKKKLINLLRIQNNFKTFKIYINKKDN